MIHTEKIKENVDIDFNERQLLVDLEGRMVVLTSGIHLEPDFSGTVIWTGDPTRWRVGYHSDNWAKRRFVLFRETIKLNNILT